MKKLCSKGYKISNVDEIALQYYLLVTPLKWSQDALKGMINKAIKTIMRDWFEKYKETINGNITPDFAVIIPALVAMPEFKMNKIQVPKGMIVKRKEKAEKEIWKDGFDVEDYEEIALFSVYENPEAMMNWFMENKIYQRRKSFVKEKQMKFIQEKKSFPANEDDFINFAVKEKGYKNRKQSEELK